MYSSLSPLKTKGKALLLIGTTVLASAGSYVWAQNGPWAPFGRQQTAQPLPEHKYEETQKEGFRYITCNGIPDHPVGQFPNRNNPNSISAQEYKFRVPLQPKSANQNRNSVTNQTLFGVALSGVPFDPGTAELWNNDRHWRYEALTGGVNLGVDSSNAHVQPDGAYHYHGLPIALIKQREKKDQMTLIGYAADGYPIYSNYGYSTASDTHSKLKKLRSSYRLKAGTRPGGQEGPGGDYDGIFTADWEYAPNSGDLDECNGRTGATPEYPKGTYYYVLTDEFPYIPRQWRGTPDSSFVKGQPGNRRGTGGMRGPGMGGPGMRPPGGPGMGRPDMGGDDFGPPFGPPPPGFEPPF